MGLKCELCRPQFPTLFADVFPIDLNAAVTLVTLASRAVFVTEAPAIHAPTMNFLRSFPCATLIQTHKKLGLFSICIQATEHDGMLIP